MTFVVNGNIWLLRFVRPSDKNLKNSLGAYTLGVTDNNVKTVFIADNLDDYMTEHVICHELTHCICFEHNIFLPFDTEEWLCNFMSDHGKEIIYLLDNLLFTLNRKLA